MVNTGIYFSSDKLSSISRVAVSAFVSGSSMMLGLWDRKTLIEVRNLDLNDAQSIKLGLQGINVGDINVVHDTNVYCHTDLDSFNTSNFEKYFSPDQLSSKGDSSTASYEKLKQQKIYSLSYVPKATNDAVANLPNKAKVHHISTGMANFSLDQSDHILVMVGDHKMSLLVHKNGFKDYAQYELEDGYDYLYYILLAAHKHQLDITKIPVHIGGNIDISSPLYGTLKAHVYNMDFCKAGKFMSGNKNHPIHYYLPLMIARACA